MQPSVPKTHDSTRLVLQKHEKHGNHPNDISTNGLYAEFRCESNGTYQIVPNPIYDKNEYAKKEVGGRGGAYKFATPPKEG